MFSGFQTILAYTNQVALGCIPQVLLGLCNFNPQSRIYMVLTCLIKIVPCWLKRILKFPCCWSARYPQWGTEETGCPLILWPWSLRESWLATYFYGGGHWGQRGINKAGVELETVVVNSILPQPLCSIMFFSLLGPCVGEDVQGGLKEHNAAHKAWQIYKAIKSVLCKTDQNPSFWYLQPSSGWTILHTTCRDTKNKNVPFNPSTVLGKPPKKQASHSQYVIFHVFLSAVGYRKNKLRLSWYGDLQRRLCRRNLFPSHG